MADTYFNKEETTKTLVEYFLCSHISESFIKAVVEQIPAADVRPVVRARWEWKNTDALVSFAWTCSACGQRKAFKTNFCPNCGADMREVNK